MRPLLGLLLLLASCTNTPKTKQDSESSPQSVIRELFAWSIDSTGALRPDREVIRIDNSEIQYREDSAERSLSFADIALISIEAAELQERGVENLRLYLAPDSASVTSSSAASGMLGLGKPFVRLARRPIGTESRLRKALSQLAALRPAPESKSPASSTPPQPPNPQASMSEAEIENKLRKLKAWHDEGLISAEEYEAAKKNLLSRY